MNHPSTAIYDSKISDLPPWLINLHMSTCLISTMSDITDFLNHCILTEGILLVYVDQSEDRLDFRYYAKYDISSIYRFIQNEDIGESIVFIREMAKKIFLRIDVSFSESPLDDVTKCIDVQLKTI